MSEFGKSTGVRRALPTVIRACLFVRKLAYEWRKSCERALEFPGWKTPNSGHRRGAGRLSEALIDDHVEPAGRPASDRAMRDAWPV